MAKKQNIFFNDKKVEVKLSDGKGYGLFAAVDLKPGELILLANVYIMSGDDWKIIKDTEPVKLYGFRWNDDYGIPLGRWKFDFKNIKDRLLWKKTEFYKKYCDDGLRLSGFLYVNDIDKNTAANVEEVFNVEKNIIGIKALTNIKAGEELIKEYNYDWKENFKSWRKGVLEGLNLPKKKYQDKIEGNYPDGRGRLTQYWDNGKIKFRHRTFNDGTWSKSTYDENGNEMYYEDSDGFWSKCEYDENGNQIYFEDSDGEIRDNRPQNINEGLNLPKKKHQDKIEGDYPDGCGLLTQYWDNGNRKFTHRTYSNGSWWKREYDKSGNQIYYENSGGYWAKREYDENGKQMYYIDSNGEIVDNRPQNINEGLNLPKMTPQSWFKSILNKTKQHTSPKYPNSIFFKLDNNIIFEYDKKIQYFWIDYYNIWSVFETKFNLNYNQIKELTKGMVEEHYKLGPVTIDAVFGFVSAWWKNITNWDQ